MTSLGKEAAHLILVLVPVHRLSIFALTFLVPFLVSCLTILTYPSPTDHGCCRLVETLNLSHVHVFFL